MKNLVPLGIRMCALILFPAMFAPSGRAQDIVIDWRTKTVVTSPQEISKGNPLKVEVTNVNNIIYDYTVVVQVTTGGSDDFSLLTAFLKPLPATDLRRQGVCEIALSDAVAQAKSIKDLLGAPGGAFNPEDKPGHFISIPLKTTQDAWNGPVSEAVTKLQGYVNSLASCLDPDSKKFVNDTYPPIKAAVEVIQKKINAPHSAEGEAPATTGEVVSVTITVHETFKGKDTIVSPYVKTLRFSSVLNVSAGVLFSRLQDRSYVQRTIPTSTGTATVLGVDGVSRLTPLLVGLLNYRLPYLDFDKVGLSVSTGPAIRLASSSSNTSSFGYFGGLSVSLWHRLFLTPGVHLGQFADFPAGFTVGQSIPPNFGPLQPVKRWTARFAFAVTYKTVSLGSLAATPKPNPPKP